MLIVLVKLNIELSTLMCNLFNTLIKIFYLRQIVLNINTENNRILILKDSQSYVYLVKKFYNGDPSFCSK